MEDKNMLPNFICPGAAKAATTTLHNLLKQHSEIYLPEVKETGFFWDEYDKGLAWYEETYFSRVQEQKIVGDITPAYMSFDYIPKRIYNSLDDDIKLIFMLRDPIERAYSHYWMSYRRGYETKSFAQAIELEEKRLKQGKETGDFERQVMVFGYIQRGMYARQIENFLEYFPVDNMKFVFFEEFITDTPMVLEEILNFLDLNFDENIDYDKQSNPSRLPLFSELRDLLWTPSNLSMKLARLLLPIKSWRRKLRNSLRKFDEKINRESFEKPEMDSEVRDRLRTVYKEEVEKLEKITGRDLDLWSVNC